ncbi:unnamed protein product, partial [Lepidochelys olivacea]
MLREEAEQSCLFSRTGRWGTPRTSSPRCSATGRCFSFGIRAGASTALIKGIARAAGSSAELITGQDRMQPQALQPAMTRILLSWDLPPRDGGGVAGPGQPQPPDTAVGGVTLQYRVQDQTYKGDAAVPPTATRWRQAARSPAGIQVAAAGAGGGRGGRVGGGPAPGAGDRPELGGRLLPHSLHGDGHGVGAAGAVAAGETGHPAGRAGTRGVFPAEAGVSAECRRLMGPGPLAGHHAGGELDRHRGRMPSQAVSLPPPPPDVPPGIWATVLAVVWLHGWATGQRDEWELLEAKAVGWVQGTLAERVPGSRQCPAGVQHWPCCLQAL